MHLDMTTVGYGQACSEADCKPALSNSQGEETTEYLSSCYSNPFNSTDGECGVNQSVEVGVLVPYGDAHLLYYQLPLQRMPISTLALVINPLALAQQGQAPNFVLRCTKQGVPIYCVVMGHRAEYIDSNPDFPPRVAITGPVGLLTYMTVCLFRRRSDLSLVLQLTTIVYLLPWTCICYSHIRFRRGLSAANIGINKKVWDKM
ncbi:hypothetical protein PMAA_043320 [Talaromyces marneffei ATCC 18224]|uniref:Uncharacterized protein n=1 Tax=Talaromyces marneffei (strain ATCC 18224 / CBS 334.59 / QM 7333) TaxID=441960 RepID=B6QR93_TALMQ|nr:hypothetical protein PMAA_043320 [Talaromyces marneffei ATCC 18224]